MTDRWRGHVPKKTEANLGFRGPSDTWDALLGPSGKEESNPIQYARGGKGESGR